MTEKDFKQIFPLGEKNDAYAIPLGGKSCDVYCFDIYNGSSRSLSLPVKR